MKQYNKNENDLSSVNSEITVTDIQTVRSRLVDKGLQYFALTVPLTLILSLSRVIEYGWNPIYIIHIIVTILIITSAVFRKRLSYPVRSSILLGVCLFLGSIGLPVFGLVGGGLTVLIVFAVIATLTFGTRAGLIACIIDLCIIVITGAAVCTGLLTFSFDINEYATSITAWGLIAGAFIMFVVAAVLALGIVYEHLTASLQDLHESNADRDRLIDNLVGAFLYRYDVKCVYTYVSSSIIQILGYSKEEFLTHFSECMTDHSVNQEAAKYTELSLNGIQQSPYELQVYHKDGSVHWLEVSERPVRDRNGKVLAVEGIAHDITHRKDAEKKQKKLQSQLSNALEIAHLGPWEYDVATDTFTFNDYFYRIFRTTAKEAGGYKLKTEEYATRFLHPDDIPRVREETIKALETNDPNYKTRIEHRIIYPDGSIGHVSVQIFIIKDNDGKTIKTYGVNQDITELKKTEQEIKKQEETHRAILHTAMDGLWIVDMEGNILEVNEAYCKMSGYSRDELAQMKISDLEINETQVEVKTHIAKITEDRIGRFESQYRKKDGSIFDVEISVQYQPLRESRMVAFIRDITESKRKQQYYRMITEMVDSAPNAITIHDC